MSNPPFISEHILPATPAQEWANATSSSLRAHTATPSDISTPGPEFPGAFPPSSGAKGSTYDTANWYIPSQNDIKNAVINAGEAAKQYLPDALTSYFPSSASASYTANNYPSSQGDVSLPRENGHDTPSQTGVSATRTNEKLQREQISETVLPLKNFHSNEIDTSFLTPHTNQNARERSSPTTNTSTQALDGSQTSTPDTSPSSPYPPGLGSSATATDEDVNQPCASDDAASINIHRDPTTFKTDRKQSPKEEVHTESEYREEVKVIQPPVVNITPRTHPLAGPGAKWKGVSLEEDYQRALDAHPDRQLNIGTTEHKGSPLNAEGRSEASGLGRQRPPNKNVDSTTADTGHSPADLSARKLAENAASNASTATMSPATGSRINNINSRTNGSSKGSATSMGTSPKSSFMDKIKGEVKVISGKLAHNEEKVEEGKRLLGKHD